VTKLILDKEENFLLASALSAIFKVHQNKTKPVSQKTGLSNLPLYPPTKFHLNIFLYSRF
jgi:hypothetical protein